MISTYNCRLVCFDLFLSAHSVRVCVSVCGCVCECSVFCVVGKNEGYRETMRSRSEITLYILPTSGSLLGAQNFQLPSLFRPNLISERVREKENVCVVTDWLLHHHIYWRRRYLLYIHKTFLYHFFVSYSIRLSQTVHCGHPYF